MAFQELDLTLPKEALNMRDAAAELAETVMRPAGIALDRLNDPEKAIAPDSVFWDVVKAHRECGFHKLMIPEAFGGLMGQVPPVTGALVSEQLGHADAGMAISAIASAMPFAMAPYFNDRKIRRIAGDYADDTRGELVGCWGITEPAHGSDWPMGATSAGSDPKLAPTLQAVRKGDDFILNGQKSAWVSNGTIATHAMLHVGLDPAMGMHGQMLAFCPLDLPGISRGKPLAKIGQRALNQGEIFFSDVVLPKRHMLYHKPLKGGDSPIARGFLGIVNGETSIIMSGLARAAYDVALSFVCEHAPEGAQIMEDDQVQHKLFEMFATTEGVRALVRRTTKYREAFLQPDMARKGAGAFFMAQQSTFAVMARWLQFMFRIYDMAMAVKPVRRAIETRLQTDRVRFRFGTGKYGVAAKVSATEAAFQIAFDALAIIGENDPAHTWPAEKLLRDARASMIEDGCNEALALVAAEDL